MTVQITDPKLVQYAETHPGETIEVVSADGRRIGTFTAHGSFVLPPGAKSPFSEEELTERRKNRTGGRPLADVLHDLKEKYGE